jgi:hypothetical protein
VPGRDIRRPRDDQLASSVDPARTPDLEGPVVRFPGLVTDVFNQVPGGDEADRLNLLQSVWCHRINLRYAWISARFHSGLEQVLMYGPPAEGVAKFGIIILSRLLSSDRHRQGC